MNTRTISIQRPSARVRDQLMDDLSSGRYQEGDQLPSIRDLVVSTGTSKSTVCSVIAMLEQELLLERRPGSGVYVKRVPRRSVGQREIGLIGLNLGPNPACHWYVRGVVQGVQAYAQTMDCKLRTILMDPAPIEKDLMEQLAGADGVILHVDSPQNVRILEAIEARGLPAVLVSRYYADHPTPAVTEDNYGGGLLATRHLLNLGHRDIGLVMGDIRQLYVEDRFRGYRDALAEAGIKLRDDRILSMGLSCPTEESDQITAFLSGPDAPEAVFFSEGLWCLRFLQGSHRVARRVPQNLSVVTMDQLDMFYNWPGMPPIDTVELQLEDIGSLALQTLLSIFDGRPVPAFSLVSMKLAVHGSAGNRDASREMCASGTGA